MDWYVFERINIRRSRGRVWAAAETAMANVKAATIVFRLRMGVLPS
jgi:hypothetical protein